MLFFFNFTHFVLHNMLEGHDERGRNQCFCEEIKGHIFYRRKKLQNTTFYNSTHCFVAKRRWPFTSLILGTKMQFCFCWWRNANTGLASHSRHVCSGNCIIQECVIIRQQVQIFSRDFSVLGNHSTHCAEHTVLRKVTVQRGLKLKKD